MLAALGIFIHLHTRREKIGLGGYFANRTHPSVENLIGDFATFHLLGVHIDPDFRVIELLRNVVTTIAQASAHQEIPFPVLKYEIASHRRQRDGGQAKPMFESAITCELIQEPPEEYVAGMVFKRMGLLTHLSRFPMPLRFLCRDCASGGDLKVGVAYHTDLFDAPAIESMLCSLQKILLGIVTHHEARVSGLSVLVHNPRAVSAS